MTKSVCLEAQEPTDYRKKYEDLLCAIEVLERDVELLTDENKKLKEALNVSMRRSD